MNLIFQFNYLIHFSDEIIQEYLPILFKSFVPIELLDKNLTFRKVRIVTDSQQVRIEMRKKTCQTMLVLNKKQV